MVNPADRSITQPLETRDGLLQLNQGTVLVNRYQVQDVVGIGGMGSVYRARDLHFPNVLKLVAVKEMINQAPDPVIRKNIVANFEREANILVTLNHNAIPKIYDFFSHDERSYLVLEFIHGQDLEAVLKKNLEPLKEDQVIIWAIEICDVLEYLHSHKPEPIIFRDVKPSNLMVNQQNHVVLVDFGIAKIFKTGQKGTMIGTEGYSPPEQYRGDATPQTDIYALGATLHHLLTHRDPRLEPPFSFSDRPIRTINSQVSQELEQIVSTALQYKPEERFPSATAMKEKLIALARKTGALSRANSGNLVLKEQTVKPVWTFQCEDEIRGSATVNANVVFVGAYDNNLYAVDAAKGEFLWKSAVGGGIISKPLVVNSQIIFGSADGKIYSVQEKTGKRNWEMPTGGPVRCSARHSEGYLYIGSDDGVLYSIDLVNSRKNWSMKAEGAIRSTPFLTPDMIYFGSEANEFFCVDLRGQVKWRFWTKKAVTSSPVVCDGIVYFASLDGLFYALDAKSGWVVWRFRMGKGSISSPTISENLVFVGSADGYIYCIERANAREVWRFKTDHQVSGSPLVHKDALYCGSADGAFYCVDLKTGRQRWRFNTEGPITGTPIADNNLVLIGSADHKLYAFIA